MRALVAASWVAGSLVACAGRKTPPPVDAGPVPAASRPPIVAPAGPAAADPPPPALAASAPPAAPEPPRLEPFQKPLPPPPAVPPARRYGNLSPAQCRAELRSRRLELKPAGGPARGIAVPLRIAGRLQGVRFVTPGARSVYGKLDCRLALVLDDVARILSAHGVVEVRIDNMYRPHAHLPRRGKRRARKPSQHSYGLAADVVEFRLGDGRTLNVERDWHGALGSVACGPDATLTEPNREAVALRNLICEIASARLFNHILTPSYDEAHRDHVHMDVKRDAREIEIR